MLKNILFLMFLFFSHQLFSQNEIYYGIKYIFKKDTLDTNNEILYFDEAKKTFAYQDQKSNKIIKLEVVENKKNSYTIKFPNQKELHKIESHAKGAILSWLSANNSIRFFVWSEPICLPNFRDNFYVYINEDKSMEIIDLMGEFLNFPEKIYYYSAKYPKGVLLNIIKRSDENDIKKYVKVSFPAQKDIIYHLEFGNIGNSYKLICVNPDKSIQLFSLFQR